MPTLTRRTFLGMAAALGASERAVLQLSIEQFCCPRGGRNRRVSSPGNKTRSQSVSRRGRSFDTCESSSLGSLSVAYTSSLLGQPAKIVTY
jgi:hypothetical protein